jgi:hypothetical protein
VRYTVRKSVVRVIGQIWMPSTTAAQTYELSDYDVDNARDDEGKITRESVQRWLDTHAGDFASVTDFEASIEDDRQCGRHGGTWGADETCQDCTFEDGTVRPKPADTVTVDIPWADEESELTFSGCMSGDEE